MNLAPNRAEIPPVETYSTVFDTLAPGRGRIEPGQPLCLWTAPPGGTP